MKSILVLLFLVITAVVLFKGVSISYAETPDEKAQKAIGEIVRPKFLESIPKGSLGIGAVIGLLIQAAYAFAGLIVTIMVVWAAYDWIISQGNKENVAKARGKITHAILGLAILALAFPVLRIFGEIFCFSFFAGHTPCS